MPQNKDFNYNLRFAGVDKLSSMMGDIRKAIGKSSKELRDSRKTEKKYAEYAGALKKSREIRREFKEAREKTAALRTEIKNTEKPTKQMALEFKRASARVKALRNQKAKSLDTLHKMRRDMKDAGLATKGWSKAQQSLKKDIKGVTDNLEKQRQSLNKVGDQYKKIAAAKDKYQQSMQTSANLSIVGAAGVAVGTRTLRGTFSMVETIRPIEQAIGEMQSLGFENLKVLRAQAKRTDEQLAYTTEASFIRAAYNVQSSMSGLSDEGVAHLTHNALVAARATRASADQMTSMMGTAYGVFRNNYKNLSDEEWSGKFTSGLSAAVKAAKTDGAKMQQALESAGQGAALLGSNMTEEFAVLAALQKTMKAGEAGTARKNFVTNAAKAQAAFSESGRNIQILDEDGMLKSTKSIMDSFRAEFGKELDGFEMADIKKAMGNDEAVKFIQAFYDSKTDFNATYSEIASAMSEGKAYTKRMAAAMDNNADAELQQAMEQWAAMKVEIGYAFLPVLKTLTPMFKKVTKFVSEFSQKHKVLIGIVGAGLVTFSALAAVMGAITIVIGAMLGPFAMLRYTKTLLGVKTLNLTRRTSRLGAAYTWMRTKAITPLILRLGVLRAAFMAKAQTTIPAAWAATRAYGKALIWKAKTAIPMAIAGIRAMGLALLANPIGLAIAAIAVGAFVLIKYWKPIKAFFGKIWQGFKVLFAWSPAGLLMRGFGVAFKWLKNIFTSPKDSANKTWNFFKTLFAWSPVGIMMKGWKVLPNLFSGIFGKLKDITGAAMDKVRGFMDGAMEKWKAFKALFSFKKIKDKIPEIATTVKAGAATTAVALSPAPALAQLSPGPNISDSPLYAPAPSAVNEGDTIIHVHAAAGMDEKALARLVAAEMAKLNRLKKRRTNSALSDIED